MSGKHMSMCFLSVLFAAVSCSPALMASRARRGGGGEYTALGAKTIITESPKGAIDGWNDEFTLDREPASGQPVQVYRNGIRLNPLTDYRIDGNRVFVAALQLPQPGDALLVSYSSRALPKPDPERKQADPIPRSNAIRSADEISIAAMRQALQSEMENATTPTLPDSRFQIHRGFICCPNKRGYRSLAILRHQGIVNTADGAQGVEGLGDSAPPSVLMLQRLARHERRLVSATTRDPQANWPFRADRHVNGIEYRSIGLLEDTMDRSEGVAITGTRNESSSESIRSRPFSEPNSLSAPTTRHTLVHTAPVSEAIIMLEHKLE